ncbi:MFS transporter [Lonsdalea quercina]|uniref:MFS transporter n=1 Tax=Lonsdalea quercina TaxID=71657 RepID=UPI003974964C
MTMQSVQDVSQRLPRSFHLLLAGQSLSLVGTQVTHLAIPLTAITLNHASPFETGVLLACSRTPYLLLGLFAGLLVDSYSHRLLLMTANIIMALTLASVPLTYFVSGQVSMSHLYTVATLTGAAMVVADVSFLAWVPALVPYLQLTKAQSRLELGQSAVMVIGLPIAGWLIAATSPAVAILADSVSFLVMSALLPFVATASSHRRSNVTSLNDPQTGSALTRILKEAAEGMRFLLRTPPLRASTFATVTLIFFYSAYSAVFILYLSDQLKMTAAEIGIVTSVAAVGCVVGALLARPTARVLGLGRTLVAAILISAAGAMLCPLLPNVLIVGLSQCVMWIGIQTYNVHQVPIRYALAPAEIHGRVNASIRTLVWGLAPLGAVVGGTCGMWLGTRATLFITGVLIAAAALWIVLSPLWAVREPQLAALRNEPAHA